MNKREKHECNFTLIYCNKRKANQLKMYINLIIQMCERMVRKIYI